MSLFVGYEVGTTKKVKIPIFHMLVSGQTRLSGKTTTLKTLATQAADQGYKVLIIDSKTSFEDYEGFGKDVPVCLKQSTDSLILIQLLESIFKRKITAYYATLTTISEDAKDYNDIIKNAENLRMRTRANFVKDACTALIDLLKRLIKEIKEIPSSTTLEIPYQINRMSINKFSDVQGQQLVAKTVFEEALHKHKKLIIILDEAYKFLPQKYSSACAQAVQNYVTQGGANECWLWLATQFLAPTNKDQMKTMAVKLLGTQDHDTECQHTLDLIPFAKGRYKVDDIMRLPLGHFITVTKKWVKKVYVCPQYADRVECLEVAMGIREPTNIHYLVKLSPEDIAKVKPEKLDKKTMEKLEPPSEILEIAPKVEVTVTPPKPKPKRVEVKKPKKRFVPKKTNLGERIELLENNLEALRTRIVNLEKNPNAKINLKQTNTIVNVENITKTVEVSDETIRGKILTAAKDGFFNAWRSLGEIFDHLINEYRWVIKKGSLTNELDRMVEEGLLGKKKFDRYKYKLAVNIKFVGN